MFDKLKEVKYFKEKSYIAKYFKQIYRLKSLKK